LHSLALSLTTLPLKRGVFKIIGANKPLSLPQELDGWSIIEQDVTTVNPRTIALVDLLTKGQRFGRKIVSFQSRLKTYILEEKTMVY